MTRIFCVPIWTEWSIIHAQSRATSLGAVSWARPKRCNQSRPVVQWGTSKGGPKRSASRASTRLVPRNEIPACTQRRNRLITPQGNPWRAGRVSNLGSSTRAGRPGVFFLRVGGGIARGTESGILGLECFDLLAGVFGLAAPLGAAAVDVGDALSESFELDLE